MGRGTHTREKHAHTRTRGIHKHICKSLDCLLLDSFGALEGREVPNRARGNKQKKNKVTPVLTLPQAVLFFSFFLAPVLPRRTPPQMRNTSFPCTASLPPGRERETSLGRVTSPHSSKTTTSSAFGFLAWITPLRLPKRTSSFPLTHLPSPFLYNEEKLLGKSLWLTTESVRCLESQVASFLIGAERRFDFVRPSPRPSRGTLRHRDRTAPGISEVREDPPKKTDFEKKQKKKSVPLSLFFFLYKRETRERRLGPGKAKNGVAAALVARTSYHCHAWYAKGIHFGS